MNLFGIIICLLPLLLGFILVYFGNIYSKNPSSPRDISISYSSAIAIIYALFLSLVFSELWNRIGRVNNLLVEQATSLRAIIRMTEPLGEDSIYFKVAVKNYINKVNQQEVGDYFLNNEQDKYNTYTFSLNTFNELYTLASQSDKFHNNTVMQSAFYSILENLRHAWFERKELKKSHVLPEKIMLLIIFGFLTQIAIAYSFLGNKNALKATVLFFSITLSIALIILKITDSSNFISHFIKMDVLTDVL
jgi:hypothetical protein